MCLHWKKRLIYQIKLRKLKKMTFEEDWYFMKRIYYKTNLSYLFVCVVVEVFLLYSAFLSRGEGGFEERAPQIFSVLYIILIFWCAIDTLHYRKELDEVVKHGHSVDAKVKKIRVVCYDYDWGLRGGLYIKCFQIEAECLEHTYYSDLVLKRYKNRIPKEVKIYSYMGKECFVWDWSKKKNIQNDFVDGEVLNGKFNRTYLSFLTLLCGSVIIITYSIIIFSKFITSFH